MKKFIIILFVISLANLAACNLKSSNGNNSGQTALNTSLVQSSQSSNNTLTKNSKPATISNKNSEIKQSKTPEEAINGYLKALKEKNYKELYKYMYKDALKFNNINSVDNLATNYLRSMDIIKQTDKFKIGEMVNFSNKDVKLYKVDILNNYGATFYEAIVNEDNSWLVSYELITKCYNLRSYEKVEKSIKKKMNNSLNLVPYMYAKTINGTFGVKYLIYNNTTKVVNIKDVKIITTVGNYSDSSINSSSFQIEVQCSADIFSYFSNVQGQLKSIVITSDDGKIYTYALDKIPEK